MITKRYVVRGRVQGVGFRFFAVRAAGRHQVTGWVRNLPDGSVECLASGAPESLDAYRRDLERGPIAARVAAVDEMETGTHEDLAGFEVRY